MVPGPPLDEDWPRSYAARSPTAGWAGSVSGSTTARKTYEDLSCQGRGIPAAACRTARTAWRPSCATTAAIGSYWWNPSLATKS